MAVSNMIKPNNSTISLRIRWKKRLPFCFKTLFSLLCWACINAHITFKSYYSHNSCESFGHTLLHTYPLLLHSGWYWETFIQSSCQLLNFWGPNYIDKKMVNSSTKCLISVKIAILTSHIIPLLVNVWLIFGLLKHKTDFVYIFKDIYRFEKWEFIAYSNRQFCM